MSPRIMLARLGAPLVHLAQPEAERVAQVGVAPVLATSLRAEGDGPVAVASVCALHAAVFEVERHAGAG